MAANTFQLSDIIFNEYINIEDWIADVNHLKTYLQVIHVNICSMRKHFNELLAFLDGCLSSLDIIVITEINPKHAEICLYNIFNTFYVTRENKRGGGIITM